MTDNAGRFEGTGRRQWRLRLLITRELPQQQYPLYDYRRQRM